MRMRSPLAALAIVGAAALAGPADATILTFDINTAQPFSNLQMDQAYGDRVTGLVQGPAAYGVGAEGFTPNVTADYSGGFEGAPLTRWSADYGDLTNVLENEFDGDTLLRVTLTADAGYTATLFGFDLAGWPDTDWTIRGLSVTSGDVVLYTLASAHVEGTGGHSAFDFGAGLTGQALAINIDLSGLGGASDNIGIDNIRFGQSPPGAAIDQPPSAVPEPSAWAMMLLGFMTIGAVTRRRRISRAPVAQVAEA